jgi:chaperonin GroES
MSFNLSCPYDKIIVKSFAKDKVTDGGILLPEASQERKAKAVVMAVGGGTKDREMVFQRGDIVYHVKDCGVSIIFDSEEYFIMRDSDVLAFIRN